VLDAPDTATLFEAESSVLFASGYLFFNRVDTRNVGKLMAQPFNPDTRQVTGDAMLIAEDIGWEGGRYASFSVSDTGTLVHAAALDNADRQLTWLDRNGGTAGVLGTVSPYASAALSPNGLDVIVQLGMNGSDIWMLSGTDNLKRLTFGPEVSNSPIWSPDGLRIAFTGVRQGAATVRTRLASGAGEETELINVGQSVQPTDWSSDGRFIAFTRGAAAGSDVWVLPMGGDRKPFPFVQTAESEAWATFSPDGRWIAYSSVDRNARSHVYARPFPPVSGGLSQISANGGNFPRWRRDGKELFFVAPDGMMMAVETDTSGENIRLGVPKPLFKRSTLISGRGRPYDVSRDGKRFLVNLPAEGFAAAPITVVVNWPAMLPH
jgi:Tol biopolymer transport system component